MSPTTRRTRHADEQATRSSPVEGAWRLAPNIREQERSKFAFFFLLSAWLGVAHSIGLTAAETIFLVRVGAEYLPQAIVLAAVITMAGTLAYAAGVGRARHDTSFTSMLSVGGLVIGLLYAASLFVAGAVVPTALFCIFFVAQAAIFVNHFWTFAGDYFDAAASQRAFPLLLAANAAGAAVGGFGAVLLVRVGGPDILIATWSPLLIGLAVMVRARRRDLDRWALRATHPAGQTSASRTPGAVRFLGSSPLARWMAISIATMVIALFVCQVLYLQIFAEKFPDPSDLAVFLSVYLAVTNVLEIFLSAALTPFLVRRLGVANANLLHPVLTVLSFGGLALGGGYVSGLFARANREMFDNAVSSAIRALLYSALPIALRGRLRALLSGFVLYTGMATAGVLILLLGDASRLELSVLGLLFSLAYMGAAFKVRRAYLRSLMALLREGLFDVSELSLAAGGTETRGLVEVWQQLLQRAGERPGRTVLELVPVLQSLGLEEPLISGARHASPKLRLACVTALSEQPGEAARVALREACDDPDADVRIQAMESIVGDDTSLLHEKLADRDPRVRALAAARLGRNGLAALASMLRSSSRAENLAGLQVAPADAVDAVRALLVARDPEVRAHVLDALARIAPEQPPASDELVDDLSAPDGRLRAAAANLLGQRADTSCAAALAAALGDPDRLVDLAVVAALTSLGGAGVEAATRMLRAKPERAVRSAIAVLAEAGEDEVIRTEFERRVQRLWGLTLVEELLPDPEQDVGARFRRMALADECSRTRRIVWCALERLEDPKVVRRVDHALRFDDTRGRGDAIEALSCLGERKATRQLGLLYGAGTLDERARDAGLAGLKTLGSAAPATDDEQFVELAHRACTQTATPEEVRRMERLLALKEVPLFASLSLEQVEAIDRIAHPVQCPPGEVIVREGDADGDLYLLLEGQVRVVNGHGTPEARDVATKDAVSYFGEMAALDRAPRSATVVATSDCLLLRLEGDRLQELILERPEVSFELLRGLSRRLREHRD